MSNMHTIRRATPRRTLRHSAGFTLIELMVVVALLVLIASMTVAAINVNTNYDKVRAGSRQVQSYLAGARDRAIYSKAPRGVRFLLDPTNNRTVSSMVFIAPTDPWTQGRIQMERLNIDADPNTADGYNAMTNPNPPVIIVRGFDLDILYPNYVATEWYDLVQRGMLGVGSRIWIPANSGKPYIVKSIGQVTSVSPRLELESPYSGPTGGLIGGPSVVAFNEGSGPQTYLLELPPTVLPNQDPVLMPKGAVIHLDRCSSPGTQSVEMTAVGNPNNSSTWTRADKIPFAWKKASTTGDPSGFDYTSRMDVLFSPRGVVIGEAAQRGIIHFYIADQKDADRDRLYWSSPSSYPTASAPEFGAWTTNASDPTYERSDKVLLSLFTRTGAVSTHHIFSNSDPFKYAETGEVAGK